MSTITQNTLDAFMIDLFPFTCAFSNLFAMVCCFGNYNIDPIIPGGVFYANANQLENWYTTNLPANLGYTIIACNSDTLALVATEEGNIFYALQDNLKMWKKIDIHTIPNIIYLAVNNEVAVLVSEQNSYYAKVENIEKWYPIFFPTQVFFSLGDTHFITSGGASTYVSDFSFSFFSKINFLDNKDIRSVSSPISDVYSYTFAISGQQKIYYSVDLENWSYVNANFISVNAERIFSTQNNNNLVILSDDGQMNLTITVYQLSNLNNIFFQNTFQNVDFLYSCALQPNSDYGIILLDTVYTSKNLFQSTTQATSDMSRLSRWIIISAAKNMALAIAGNAYYIYLNPNVADNNASWVYTNTFFSRPQYAFLTEKNGVYCAYALANFQIFNIFFSDKNEFINNSWNLLYTFPSFLTSILPCCAANDESIFCARNTATGVASIFYAPISENNWQRIDLQLSQSLKGQLCLSNDVVVYAQGVQVVYALFDDLQSWLPLPLFEVLPGEYDIINSASITAKNELLLGGDIFVYYFPNVLQNPEMYQKISVFENVINFTPVWLVSITDKYMFAVSAGTIGESSGVYYSQKGENFFQLVADSDLVLQYGYPSTIFENNLIAPARNTGIFLITVKDAPCFLSKTKILLVYPDTLVQYEKEIKDIQPGETVVSPLHGLKKVKKVVKDKISFFTSTNYPIHIKKNTLAQNTLPKDDVYISGHHRIIVMQDKDCHIGVQAYRIDGIKENALSKKDVLEITKEDDVYFYNILLEDNANGLFASGIAVESLQEEEMNL